MIAKKDIFLVFVISILYVAPTGAARLYKVVDEFGNVSYQARPAPLDPGVITEEKNFGDGGQRTPNSSLAQIARKNPVVIYTAPNCNSCDNARKFLDNLNIPYTDKNAQGNDEVSEELRRVSGGLTVPVITIGKKALVGFTKPWLESELEKAGYPVPGEKTAQQ